MTDFVRTYAPYVVIGALFGFVLVPVYIVITGLF